jgi:CDP-2,3-bis-(O-geranylgeranyl)-sn-glycerol synthase
MLVRRPASAIEMAQASAAPPLGLPPGRLRCLNRAHGRLTMVSRDPRVVAMARALQLLYLMLPVYAANMAAPFARMLPGDPRPISQRWLGAHKTWRGCALAVLAATAAAWAQSRIEWSGSLVSYHHWLALGLLCGAAAMAGDSAKSFFKRRLGIAPGRPWIPFDQLDYVVAGLLALSPWHRFGAAEVALVVAVSFFGSLAVNYLSARLGIKSSPW